VASGLTNGVHYYFRVSAHNAVGFGPYSTVVGAVPRTVSTTPRSPTATPGNASVKLTWLAPSSNGGATVDKYAVQRSTTGTSGWTNIAFPTGLGYTATALSNGTPYYFRIVAHNVAGWSPVSTVVKAIPRTVPSAPRSVVATPGIGNVKLTWIAPSSSGGATVDKYAVQRSMTGTSGWTNIAFPAGTFNYMVSSLTNGTHYYFRLLAHNAAGWSPASPVVSAVPRTVPTAVPACHASQASPGSTWIVLQWQAPYGNGGAPIESYWVEIWKNGAFYYGKQTLAVASFVDAFAVGSYGSYEVRVSARNDAGDGASCTTYVAMWP
jgi:titin